MNIANPDTLNATRGIVVASAQGLPQVRLPSLTSIKSIMETTINRQPKTDDNPVVRIPKRKNLRFIATDFEFSMSLPFPVQTISSIAFNFGYQKNTSHQHTSSSHDYYWMKQRYHQTATGNRAIGTSPYKHTKESRSEHT